MVALVLVMLQFNPFSRKLHVDGFDLEFSFLDVPVYIAGFFTAVSGFGYIAEGIAQLHARGHGEPLGNKKDNF
jgi:hypothetical protein